MKLQKWIAVILSVLILLSLAGCGAAMDAADAPAKGNENYVADDYIVKEEADAEAESSSSLPENRKLIQTVTMSIETEDLDTVLAQLDSRVAELGGYVEASSVQNGSMYSGKRYRSANLTVRIPAENLDAFVDKVGQVSNIVSSRKTVDDITLSYVATESRVKALQAEEARLLELMAQAETMDDLLQIEARLTDVRTELEQVTTTLKVYDNQVTYATINMDVSEVTEYTDVSEPETLWDRITNGFAKSLKGVGSFLKELLVFLVVSLPYVVLIAAFNIGIVLIIRACIRRKRKQQEKNSH